MRHSSALVSNTGIALGCTGPTTPFASIVTNENSWCSSGTGSSSFGPRTPVQGRQIPAKAKSGRLSSRANHTGVLRGFVSAYSLNEVTGTRQRCTGLSQGRQ
ncbi:hypothetical protein MPEAHAMD_7265 [Methylobacterium frigidaeris]|uniref:Uncharacterized protein n=1 Tax=Methylobacterium frigidaeris TaxID=2038277 RepID=A0AA37M9B8_9HYPH|nr:hypothetical protein MPEAHAMD_7265 [Methylobacterium frigidaeris]